MRITADKGGRGQKLAKFCGRLLWMAPKYLRNHENYYVDIEVSYNELFACKKQAEFFQHFE